MKWDVQPNFMHDKLAKEANIEAADNRGMNGSCQKVFGICIGGIMRILKF